MDSLTIQNVLRGMPGVGQLGQGGLGGGIGSIEAPTIEAPTTIVAPATTEVPETGGAFDGPSFQETLNGFLGEVNQQVLHADQGMADLAAGKTNDIQDVLIDMRKADFQVKLLVEARNKVLDAYKEVMSISA
jgi:flagellar hook-basal body complex protein FliE